MSEIVKLKVGIAKKISKSSINWLSRANFNKRKKRSEDRFIEGEEHAPCALFHRGWDLSPDPGDAHPVWGQHECC